MNVPIRPPRTGVNALSGVRGMGVEEVVVLEVRNGVATLACGTCLFFAPPLGKSIGGSANEPSVWPRLHSPVIKKQCGLATFPNNVQRILTPQERPDGLFPSTICVLWRLRRNVATLSAIQLAPLFYASNRASIGPLCKSFLSNLASR